MDIIRKIAHYRSLGSKKSLKNTL